MNKYSVRLGYSCTSYGNLTGYVFANSLEEAEELVCDRDNIHETDYESNDSDDYNYYEDEAEIDLETENVTLLAEHQNTSQTNTPFINLPSYFLAELNAL
ncbi:MAG TPA: hypothetical protein VIL99_05605 [Ignavibacteria bacterium]